MHAMKRGKNLRTSWWARPIAVIAAFSVFGLGSVASAFADDTTPPAPPGDSSVVVTDTGTPATTNTTAKADVKVDVAPKADTTPKADSAPSGTVTDEKSAPAEVAPPAPPPVEAPVAQAPAPEPAPAPAAPADEAAQPNAPPAAEAPAPAPAPEPAPAVAPKTASSTPVAVGTLVFTTLGGSVGLNLDGSGQLVHADAVGGSHITLSVSNGGHTSSQNYVTNAEPFITSFNTGFALVDGPVTVKVTGLADMTGTVTGSTPACVTLTDANIGQYGTYAPGEMSSTVTLRAREGGYCNDWSFVKVGHSYDNPKTTWPQTVRQVSVGSVGKSRLTATVTADQWCQTDDYPGTGPAVGDKLTGPGQDYEANHPMLATLFGMAGNKSYWVNESCDSGGQVCESLAGAIFTTDASGKPVNHNIYESKEDVYLQGGPDTQGAHLPDGTYYVRVTDPSDNEVLRDTFQVVVADGVFPSTQLAPFKDTPNPGGEYKVWLSTSPDFSGKCTKTDNFKVKKSNPLPKDATADVTVSNPTCAGNGVATVTGLNYATLVGTLDQSVGTHEATFKSITDHLFADGTDTFKKSYTIGAQLTGEQCAPPPDKPAHLQQVVFQTTDLPPLVSEQLAYTGFDAVQLLAFAFGFFAGGVGLVIFSRRRRRSQDAAA